MSGTPQSKPTGPMTSDQFGASMASKVFASRKGHGGAPASEIHLKEAELALLLGAAYEIAIETARAVIESALPKASK